MRRTLCLQEEELEEALLDAVQWRLRTLITIQLAVRNISRSSRLRTRFGKQEGEKPAGD